MAFSSNTSRQLNNVDRTLILNLALTDGLMGGWLPFVEHLFVLLSSIVSLCSQIFLLYKCSRKPLKGRLSVNLLINVVCWCITAFFGIIHGSYMTSYWQKDGNMIFWTGTLFYTSTAMVSISVTFLMLDRIYILLWPAGFRKHKEALHIVTILSILIGGFIVLLLLALLELPVDEVTLCPSWGCVLKFNKGYTCVGAKLFTGCSNFLIALVFIFLMFRHNSTSVFSQKNFKRTNFLALLAAITELFLNLLPNAFFVFNSVIGFAQWDAYGPYLASSAALDGLCAAFIYQWLIVLKPKNKYKNKTKICTIFSRAINNTTTVTQIPKTGTGYAHSTMVTPR